MNEEPAAALAGDIAFDRRIDHADARGKERGDAGAAAPARVVVNGGIVSHDERPEAVDAAAVARGRTVRHGAADDLEPAGVVNGTAE